MSVDAEALFVESFCLAEVSKNVDGQLLVLDPIQKACANPTCNSLTLIQNLRLNVQSANCDTRLGALLDGMIRVWNLRACKNTTSGVWGLPVKWSDGVECGHPCGR